LTDSLVGGGLAAINASGIDAKKDINAVSSPLGDLRGRNACVEPE
jgi:hypothetical protein